MDRRTNPYAPGAGTPPPELAGRGTLAEDAEIALDRLGNGLAAKSHLMVGLHGVGKTVFLNRIFLDAVARDCAAVLIEAPEYRSLTAALAGPLNSVSLQPSRSADASESVRNARKASRTAETWTLISLRDSTLGERWPVPGARPLHSRDAFRGQRNSAHSSRPCTPSRNAGYRLR